MKLQIKNSFYENIKILSLSLNNQNEKVSYN